MTRSAAFLAMTLAATLAAQPPRGKQKTTPGGIPPAAMAYNGTGIVRLLENPEVQNQLKVTKEVMENLPLLREELTESNRKFAQALKDATDNRDAFLQALIVHSRQMDKQIEELLGTQFTRFKEIRRRAFGIASAMTADAEVREAVAMTEDQRTKLNVGRDALKMKMDDSFRNKGKRRLPPGELDEGVRSYWSDEEKLFMDILTEAQRNKWKGLIGEPFEVPNEIERMVRRGDFDGKRSADSPGGERPRRKKRGNDRENPPGKTEPEKKPPVG